MWLSADTQTQTGFTGGLKNKTKSLKLTPKHEQKLKFFKRKVKLLKKRKKKQLHTCATLKLKSIYFSFKKWKKKKQEQKLSALKRLSLLESTYLAEFLVAGRGDGHPLEPV